MKILICNICGQTQQGKRKRLCLDKLFRCKNCYHKYDLEINQKKWARSPKGRLTQKRTREKDKEKIRQRIKNWKEQNQKKIRGYCRARYWADPVYGRLRTTARRNKTEIDLLRIVLERDKICQHCGTENNLSFDHKIPVSKGGKVKTSDDLQILCISCNSRKGNRYSEAA